MDSALVVSADSDVAPAIRAAWKLHPSLFVAAAFPPNRSSSEVRALMPNSYQIGVARLRKAQMPDVVTAATLENLYNAALAADDREVVLR
jgi:hypothetical protein